MNEQQSFSRSGWISRRPILVWMIFAFCTLQLIAILLMMNQTNYLDAVRAGEVSPAHALLGFAYPFLLFIGGMLLVFLRKSALVVFAIYLAWGGVKLAGGAGISVAISLVLVAATVVYCWLLKACGKLS